ncbi:unnamed protein product [Ceratitis capitata]|uniref:(Mediterranean fruit fly) hypothetical protein n=1 Tax=Ceratitis capitata TaxID=7213 RepID=A0A811V575_CERCA|nr:unnamed protein product [Ceratitis capitata]
MEWSGVGGVVALVICCLLQAKLVLWCLGCTPSAVRHQLNSTQLCSPELNTALSSMGNLAELISNKRALSEIYSLLMLGNRNSQNSARAQSLTLCLYEYLFKELQSLYDEDDVSHVHTQRTRREAIDSKECDKRSWKKDMHCCKDSNANGEQLALFRSVKKECIAELKGEPADDAFNPFDCEKMKQVKEQMICISECIAKKLKSLDEEGELKRDAILEGLRAQIVMHNGR